MDQVVEQLLGFRVGGAVDDPLGVDDGVESAQGVESALLKREQARGPFGGVGHAPIVLENDLTIPRDHMKNVQLSIAKSGKMGKIRMP